ncbi:glycosyltransferase family 39 protein [Leptolyngbya sp. AN02str]|uniref:glycosyltransferase family 39 protein n=1 Tax=Leptolyngbya sp. AN02str TaxID=3423363 RepID=UPI003D3200FA
MMGLWLLNLDAPMGAILGENAKGEHQSCLLKICVFGNVVKQRWVPPWTTIGLLLLWIAIGAVLRFTNLAAKPPWIDEFATLVFSLGHSFTEVPLDQPIALSELLAPVQMDTLAPSVRAHQVLDYLLTESTHPPLYFVLAGWWMDLWQGDRVMASIGVARSLPALLGTAAIPAMFGMGWLGFRSLPIAHFSAAMLAVSPYAVFLTQEARHYALAMLWVMASVACLVAAMRSLQNQLPMPYWLMLLWIVINALGVATHYFFTLTLGAIGLSLIWFLWQDARQSWRHLLKLHWLRMYGVALGSLVGGLVWLPLLRSIHSNQLTQWIQNDDGWTLRAIVSPIFQALAAWITMQMLLPVEAEQLPIIIIAGAVMIGIAVLTWPRLWQGLRQWLAPSPQQGVAQSLVGTALGAIAIMFAVTYGFGADLTRGARYHFLYFPVVMLVIGASLAMLWQRRRLTRWLSDRQVVVLVLVVGVLSGITVINNLGYRKYYRPDILVPIVQQNSESVPLIATTQQTLVQTGEMMGLAYEFWQRGDESPQFLLARQAQMPCTNECVAGATLVSTIQAVGEATSASLDLWLVNFKANVELEAIGCEPDTAIAPDQVSGYRYQHYRCVPTRAARLDRQPEADRA